MATTPIGTSAPWGWVPPEWDTSAGVAPGQLEDPLVPVPDVVDAPWPPPEWIAPDAAAAQAADTQQVLAAAEAQKQEGDARRRLEAEQLAAQRVQAGEVDEGWPPASWTQEEREEPELGDPNFEADADELVEMEDNSGLVDPYADDAGGEIEFTEEDAARDKAADIANMSAEELAEYQATKQHNAELERARREKELNERQLRLLEENVARRDAARQQAQAELADVSARAKQLADGSPFEQWWSTRSTGQKIAGYLAAMLGGYLAPRTGGRNSAIDFMTKLAEDDANQKWLALREEKGVALDKLGQADEDHRSREAFRLASYEQLARGIESELALLDPEGTAALKLREARDAVRGQQAAAMAAAEKAAFDRADKMIAREQEQQKINLEAAKVEDAAIKWREEMKRKAAAGVSAKTLYPPEYFEALGLPKPKIPMTDKAYDQWLDRTRQAGMIEGAETTRATTEAREKREVAKETRELTIAPGSQLTPGSLVNADGTPYIAPDAETARALRKQVASTISAANIIDDILRLRNQHGWSSDLVKSPEWRAMQANKGALIIELKNAAELGALAGPDVDVINSMLGTSDPTELRDPSEGLREARRNAIRRTQRSLEAANPNFSGKFDVIDKSAPKKPGRDKDVDALAGNELALSGGFGARPTLSKNQRLGLRDLKKRAAAGDDVAIEGLAQNARHRNPAVRDAAAAALVDLARNEKAATQVRAALAGLLQFDLPASGSEKAAAKVREAVAANPFGKDEK